jgi:hypothetical protein
LESEIVKAKISLLTFLVILVLSGFAVFRLTTNRSNAQTPETEKTRKQKEHSKLYKEYDTGPKLQDLAAKGTGDLVVADDTPIQVDFGIARPPFLKGITCDADAIVVGVLNSQHTSHLTEGGSFIFTDYELTVKDVVKDNAAASIQPGRAITITRSGGEVQINGRTVRAIDDSFKPFKVGERYVLFLRFISATGAYRASGSGSFQLRDDRVTKLGDAITQWGTVRDDASAFIAEVRAEMAAGDCTSGLKALTR